MPIKREESEFAKFPVDQVVDWLGHPVTEHLRTVMTEALIVCDGKAVELCDKANGYEDPGLLHQDAAAIGAARKAYQQVRAFIEEANDYVKAQP